MLKIRFRTLLVLAAILCMLQPAASALAAYELESDDPSAEPYTSYYQSYLKAYSIPEPVQSAAPSEEAAAGTAEPAALTYVVNPGDTLFKIARDFGIAVQSLQAYNDIRNANALQIGQKLSIPSVPADVPKLDGKEPVIQKVLSSTLTAYTSGIESTGKTPSHPAYGITYSGVKAEEGRTVAVDPSIIPLGSTVYIEGIGIRKAEDTGSAIKGAKIDVYMNDLEEAQTFGVKRNVKVFVLRSA